MQTTDTTAQEVTSELSKHILSSDDWTIEDGPNGTKILFHKNRMYIPDDITLRRKIISDHHDTSVTGHPSILGTLRAIRMAYFWPGMQQFVRNYVNGCAVCQQFKVSTHPTKPQLIPIPSGSPRLFGSIGIDFMTDLPLSADGYDSVMVTVDYGSSKGVILTKTSKTGLTAEHTAQLFIDDVYSRFGLPDKIMTDRGTQFNSDFFKDLCHKLDIKPSMTTAFHPQANGGTERVNQEIQCYLSIFCINNPTSWPQALKKAEFVYNNRPHADRSQSPFELMYGEAPRAFPTAFGHSQFPTVQARIDQLNQWRKDAIIAHDYARERMKTRIKENYIPFKIGQKVWLEGRDLKLNYNKKITMK